MNNYIEIQRNNVTVAEFLNKVKWACIAKGMSFEMSREDFENPPTEYMNSYSVIDGKKKCHFSERRTVTKRRRKHASYEIPNGHGGTYTRYYYTDEYEEYDESEIHRWDAEYDAEDAPCKAETFKQFAYDHQTYILNWDGSCYNECIEFTFDDDKRGHGYYYQVNKDAE